MPNFRMSIELVDVSRRDQPCKLNNVLVEFQSHGVSLSYLKDTMTRMPGYSRFFDAYSDQAYSTYFTPPQRLRFYMRAVRERSNANHDIK